MRRGGLAILLIGMGSSGAPGQTEFEAPRSDVIVSEKDEVDLVDEYRIVFGLRGDKAVGREEGCVVSPGTGGNVIWALQGARGGDDGLRGLRRPGEV